MLSFWTGLKYCHVANCKKTPIYIYDPSREKGPYRNSKIKIIKTGTKQAQADMVQ